MTKSILITGATGFIASGLCRFLLANSDWNIVGLVRCKNTGNEAKLGNYDTKRLRLIHHDLQSTINNNIASRIGNIDYIAHLAACSDVDVSIKDPLSCVLDNVVGTLNILEYARTKKIEKFLYFGTDEVFGPAKKNENGSLDKFQEWDRYNSSNPYSASKAGGEELSLAFHNTYKVPVVVTHTMNVIGRYQHKNKFIPSTIKKILNNEIVLIHGDGLHNPCSRFYIHVDDVSRTIVDLLLNANTGDKYNIVGDKEVNGLEMVEMISKLLETKAIYKIVDSTTSSRPGHDMYYSLDGSKIKAFTSPNKISFIEALKDAVDFYKNNPEWLE